MTATWRSMLFVPGNRPDMAAKAPRSAPDVVVLDLEDAVPPAAKPDARATVRQVAADVAVKLTAYLADPQPDAQPFWSGGREKSDLVLLTYADTLPDAGLPTRLGLAAVAGGEPRALSGVELEQGAINGALARLSSDTSSALPSTSPSASR